MTTEDEEDLFENWLAHMDDALAEFFAVEGDLPTGKASRRWGLLTLESIGPTRTDRPARASLRPAVPVQGEQLRRRRAA